MTSSSMYTGHALPLSILTCGLEECNPILKIDEVKGRAMASNAARIMPAMIIPIVKLM
jgi:hypothetical protein